MPPERLGSYEILERLGAGWLFKARAGDDGDLVALKALPWWKQSSEEMARFDRQVRLENSIRHENVARFIELGRGRVTSPNLLREASEGEVIFLVRELVEGRSIEQLLSEGSLPLAISLNVAIQCCRGLGVLHEHGVVHRNLTSRNVLLCPDGTAKLVDFGLIKILRDEAESENAFKTATGMLVGTTGYMAPEQFRGDPVDQRSDLFSLGALFYEMLCGQKPFPADDLMSHFHAMLEDDPAPPSTVRAGVPDQLDGVVARLLEKRVEDRYSSAAEAEAQLRACLGHPDV